MTVKGLGPEFWDGAMFGAGLTWGLYYLGRAARGFWKWKTWRKDTREYMRRWADGTETHSDEEKE